VPDDGTLSRTCYSGWQT